MHDPLDQDSSALRDLLKQAASGAISRRQALRRAAALGIGSGALERLLAASPASASPAPRSSRTLRRAAGDPKTLTLALDGSPSDLDPHSCYDYRSTMAILGPYEGLIGLKGGA